MTTFVLYAVLKKYSLKANPMNKMKKPILMPCQMAEIMKVVAIGTI